MDGHLALLISNNSMREAVSEHACIFQTMISSSVLLLAILHSMTSLGFAGWAIQRCFTPHYNHWWKATSVVAICTVTTAYFALKNDEKKQKICLHLTRKLTLQHYYTALLGVEKPAMWNKCERSSKCGTMTSLIREKGRFFCSSMRLKLNSHIFCWFIVLMEPLHN